MPKIQTRTVRESTTLRRETVAPEALREKLVTNGPDLLSMKELLALILHRGEHDRDALTLAGRISREYGEQSLTSLRDVKRVADALAIEASRACQIVAAAELGRRFGRQTRFGGTVIKNAKEVSTHVRDMHHLSKECLRGLYFDGHHRMIHDELLSLGSVDANIAHPREIFRPALEHAASAVVLVHNHPSGIVTPSANDIEVTKQVVEAGKIMGIPLLDHVIVGRGKFASIPVSYD